MVSFSYSRKSRERLVPALGPSESGVTATVLRPRLRNWIPEALADWDQLLAQYLMEIDSSSMASVKEELAALWALRARIKSQTYIDQLHKQIEDIRALPRLLASVENQEQGRMFVKKALQKSLLLREKVHLLLKKHGASLTASD